MPPSQLSEFVRWARSARKDHIVSVIRALDRAFHLPENQRDVYMQATADMLQIDDLPRLMTVDQTSKRPAKRVKRAHLVTSDSENEDTSEDENDDTEDEEIVIGPSEKFVPGRFYTMPTQTQDGNTEQSFFLADTPTDVTWLYTHDQLSSVFDADDIPLRTHAKELYMSDHRERNLVVPSTVKLTQVRVHRQKHASEHCIAGFCKTSRPPCILAFTDQATLNEQSLRKQADDYIRVLLARGGNPSTALDEAVRATKSFSSERSTSSRPSRCSACGLTRSTTYNVKIGSPPRIHRLGSFCYERVRLAWQLSHASSTTELRALCTRFRNEMV